ncbi:MAG TPA: CYTH domain-containing protein, partial [Ktedonobacteraceae bacterium]
MIEVEIKLELTPRLLAKLQELFDFLPSVQFINQTYQVDSYYDTQQHTCFRQAVFLRVRNQAALEIKYHDVADPLHTQCIERVFPLDAEAHVIEELNVLGARFIARWRNAATVEEALERNELAEFVCIEKQRSHYRYRDVLICIDTIPGLGHFLELEISCKEDQEIAWA